MAKSGFDGNGNYNANNAVTISKDKLSEMGVRHADITGQQHSLYSQFSKSGQTLTMEAMKEIEIQAMVNSGDPLDYATNAVNKAIEQLLEWGITSPSRIPWGK